MTDKTIIPILPPYLDCPATHNGKGDPSAGLSVFLLKLIVALSPWFEDDGYEFNDEYCEGLMHAVERM